MLAACLVLPSVAAHADTLNYNIAFTNTNFCQFEFGPCEAFILDFQISSTAVPESHTANSFTFGADQVKSGSGNVPAFDGDFTIFTDQQFFFGDLFPNADPSANAVGYGEIFTTLTNLQLFTGSTAHPTLLTGSSGPLFDGTANTVTTVGQTNPGGSDFAGSTIITDIDAPAAPTPEPSTLLLLGTGLAAACTHLRRHLA